MKLHKWEDVARVCPSCARRSAGLRSKSPVPWRWPRLRRYIEALGGKLEVSAIFEDKRVRLKGI